jgi:hypothetical protein
MFRFTTTDQAAAVAAVRALHDEGHAATLVSDEQQTRWAAVNLDHPHRVADTLTDLGWALDAAHREAARLIRRGY